MLRDLQTLFRSGAIGGLGDGELLAMFAARPGEAAEAAFAALVERHGPVVLRACRGLLRDEHAAQDAFQATFLILARRAGGIWVRDSLGPWLHGVACRVAGDARKSEARRIARERRAVVVTARGFAPGIKDDGGELRAALHEEIGRLSAPQRAAVVLCDLEGRSHEEAARLIGCPVGTVKSRQARARERLRARLARRGLAPSAGLVAASLASGADAAVPASLASATVRAALGSAIGRGAAGALSAGLAEASRAFGSLGATRLRALAPALLAAATVAGGVAYRAGPGAASSDPGPSGRGQGRASAPAGRPSPLGPRLDRDGDPLPPGARLRLGTKRSRQESRINGIAFSPDGRAVVTGVGKGGLQVWDPKDGTRVRRIHIGIESMRDFAFRGDGEVLAAVGFSFDAQRRRTGNVLSLVDFASGRPLRRIEWEDEADVWCLAFSPDGASIATGSGDGVVRLWDAASGEERLKLKLGPVDVQAVAFSPGGETLAACSRDGSALRNRIHLVDLEHGREIRTLSGHERPIRSLAFSPDGRMLVSGGERDAVILWDVASGRELRRLDGGERHHGTVAFSPDGTTVAASGGEGAVTVWDVATGRPRRRIESSQDWYGRMAFSPDGKTIASSSDPVLHLWDVETGRDRIEEPEAHGQIVARLLCADGGRTLITGGDDGTARVWDLTTGRQRAVLRHAGQVRALALSPDGKTLATGTSSEAGIKLWDLATGGALRSCPVAGLNEFAAAITFNSEGDAILAVWSDGSVRRFETTTGREVPAVRPEIAYPPREFGAGPVQSAVFSPGGGILAVCGPFGQGIHVADITTGRELFRADGDSIALSADGKTLAVSDRVPSQIPLADGRTRTTPGEGTIRLYDVATGEERLQIRRPSSNFFSLAFSPDGTALAAVQVQGGKSHGVRAFRTDDGRDLATLRGLDAPASCIGFTPDGQGLVTGLHDTTVLVWDATWGR